MFSSWPFHGQTIFTLFERLDNLFCIITIDKKIFYNSITYCYYWCCILFLWLWIYCAMKLPWFWVLMMNMDLSFTNVIQLVITLVTRYIEDLLSLWLMFRFFVLFNEKIKHDDDKFNSIKVSLLHISLPILTTQTLALKTITCHHKILKWRGGWGWLSKIACFYFVKNCYSLFFNTSVRFRN